MDQKNEIRTQGDVTNQPVAVASNDVPWAAVAVAVVALFLFYKLLRWNIGQAAAIESVGMKSVKQAVARRNGQWLFDWMIVKPVSVAYRSKRV